jgi:hypothetical protein
VLAYEMSLQKNTINFMHCKFTLSGIFSLIEVKEDEIGRACSTNGGDEECISDIGGKARRKETTSKTKT